MLLWYRGFHRLASMPPLLLLLLLLPLLLFQPRQVGVQAAPAPQAARQSSTALRAMGLARKHLDSGVNKTRAFLARLKSQRLMNKEMPAALRDLAESLRNGDSAAEDLDRLLQLLPKMESQEHDASWKNELELIRKELYTALEYIRYWLGVDRAGSPASANPLPDLPSPVPHSERELGFVRAFAVLESLLKAAQQLAANIAADLRLHRDN